MFPLLGPTFHVLHLFAPPRVARDDPTTGGPHTAHTTYDVECILVDDRLRGKKLRKGGRLADIAPTALQMWGIETPKEMTGQSLIAT